MDDALEQIGDLKVISENRSSHIFINFTDHRPSVEMIIKRKLQISDLTNIVSNRIHVPQDQLLIKMDELANNDEQSSQYILYQKPTENTDTENGSSLKDGEADPEKINYLVNLGFSKLLVTKALSTANNDIEKALAMLRMKPNSEKDVITNGPEYESDLILIQVNNDKENTTGDDPSATSNTNENEEDKNSDDESDMIADIPRKEKEAVYLSFKEMDFDERQHNIAFVDIKSKNYKGHKDHTNVELDKHPHMYRDEYNLIIEARLHPEVLPVKYQEYLEEDEDTKFDIRIADRKVYIERVPRNRIALLKSITFNELYMIYKIRNDIKAGKLRKVSRSDIKQRFDESIRPGKIFVPREAIERMHSDSRPILKKKVVSSSSSSSSSKANSEDEIDENLRSEENSNESKSSSAADQSASEDPKPTYDEAEEVDIPNDPGEDIKIPEEGAKIIHRNRTQVHLAVPQAKPPPSVEKVLSSDDDEEIDKKLKAADEIADKENPEKVESDKEKPDKQEESEKYKNDKQDEPEKEKSDKQEETDKSDKNDKQDEPEKEKSGKQEESEKEKSNNDDASLTDLIQKVREIVITDKFAKHILKKSKNDPQLAAKLAVKFYSMTSPNLYFD